MMLVAHQQACATTELRTSNKHRASWLEAWRKGPLLTEGGKRRVSLLVRWTGTAGNAGGCTGHELKVQHEALSTALKPVSRVCALEAGDALVATTVKKRKVGSANRLQFISAEDVKTPKAQYRTGRVKSWHREFKNLQRYPFPMVTGDALPELGYAAKGWWAEEHHRKSLLPAAAQARELIWRGTQTDAGLIGLDSIDASRCALAAP
jgi:hypothetical protein